MAELIIPKIDVENYKAFCELLGVGMPTTYADWLHDRSDEIAHNESLGHTSREVAIYPDEVTKFLKGRAPNADPVKSLEEFLLKGPLNSRASPRQKCSVGACTCCCDDHHAQATPLSASRWTGTGRWMDDIFIERLWRSLKYEWVFLNAFETSTEALAGIGRWIGHYNVADRTHRLLPDPRRGLSAPTTEILAA